MKYSRAITIEDNLKGVLDLDVTKGCASGIAATKDGCYGLCYAARAARRRGLDFSKTVVRHFKSWDHYNQICLAIRKSPCLFVRVGTAGDPSEAWAHTARVCEMICGARKPIIVITKHWQRADDDILLRLKGAGVYLNTSTSPLDTEAQREYRLSQYVRFLSMGGRSVLRVVTVNPNKETPEGRALYDIQNELLSHSHVIDNPLRAFKNYPLVRRGIIELQKAPGHAKAQLVSLHDESVYLGHCSSCPDQCGVTMFEGGVA